MATTKFYLDQRGKARDGKKPIVIVLSNRSTSVTIGTGIRVSEKEWNGSKVIHRQDSSVLNGLLSKKKAEIDEGIARLSLVESLQKMSAAEIKHAIKGEKDNEQRHYISTLFDEYMQHGLSAGTVEIYNLTKKKVLAYGGQKLKVDSINTKWIYDFEKYLAKTQKSANGRSIYLRALRAVCKYAVKTDVVSKCPFDNFYIRQEPTQKRSIELERFRKFMSCPTTEMNEMYRDYFMLIFYLVGINIADLLKAKKTDVVNGRLEYDRQKTHKHYSIKIEPEAQELIDRHSGHGVYLLDALDHCKLYKSFAHQMNDALKTIGETQYEEIPDTDSLFAEPTKVQTIVPIIPGISTYYARHSWATFAAELDISSDIIGQALGHSNANRTTMIYIKPNPAKVDEVNRKVIDYVLGK